MPQVRITDDAFEKGLAVPMGEMTKSERFSLLILRGAGQEEQCHKHYLLGAIDLKDRLIAEGVHNAIIDRVLAELIAEYR